MQLFGNSRAYWTIEDNCFARGGEGEIYKIVGNDKLVAKIYKDGALNATRQEKLVYMSSIYSGGRFQQLAWPEDVLKDAYGNVKGFIMRRFPATKDLADLLDGSSNSTDNLDWLKRIVIALNLSDLVNEIHSLGQVIGDMNPKNFGVDMGNGHVCAFDTDSFHLRNKNTGKWYPCTVLDEHYIAPEFQASLKTGRRVDSFRPEETFTRETDNFALAVLIFQLLFNGVHPFTAARIASRGSSVVIHTRETNIYQRMSPFFNPSPNTTIPIYAPPVSIVPKKVYEMFRRAFLENTRPTAQEWFTELTSLKTQVQKCPIGHYYGKYNKECPWCNLDDKINKAKVGPYLQKSTNNTKTSTAKQKTTKPGSTKPGTTTPGSTTPGPKIIPLPSANPPKKSGWGLVIIAAIILIIMVICISNSSIDNNNSKTSGNGLANNRTIQEMTPTVKAAAKPTTAPVSRTFSFDSRFDVTDGVVKISWTDSKRKSPYTVRYQYINDSSSVKQTTIRLGTTSSTYMECPYFIPGSKYKITVTDADGAKATTIFTYSSARSFSDGKLKASSFKLSVSPRSITSSNISAKKWSLAKPCTFSAITMASNIRSNTIHYGLYIEISHPSLAYTRTYKLLFAYYAPNGYVDSYYQDITLKTNYLSYYWNIQICDFFDDLYEKFGEIPSGNYTLKLFLNGQSVRTQSFYVNR